MAVPIKHHTSINGSMLKRLFDFIVALMGLVISFIPMLLIALLIRLKMGAPVLFRHTRPGLKAKPFVLYKFRTMSNLRDESGGLILESDDVPANKERLASFGNFLRKTSLDELPELINVIKGEMSLVGPRPLLMKYLSLYNNEQKNRHAVKPGLTGWAQVNGRNSISWEKRFELDVWYVNNQSFLLDIKIIYLTLKLMLNRKGIYTTDDTIMPEFTGSEEQKELHN